MTANATPWPGALWQSPLLRHLDAGARDQLAAAARLVELGPSAVAYREGDDSDTFFLVVAGSIALRPVRRGDEVDSVLRVVQAGDSFGEEALLAGLRRRTTACAVEGASVAEIPNTVFRRLAGRGGGARALEREWRYLERAAARDLLAASALGRDLGADDSEILLDGLRLERFERGAHLFEAGDRADRCFILVDGLVQMQSDADGRTSVVAYLGRGDLFGDEEALAGQPRSAAAVAAGDSWCASVPADILRTVSDRNPGLVPRLRRIAHRRRADQDELVAAAAARSTQHVFRDLYRMQVARSLLVIDQDSCVRCGHCAWSCAEVHGVSRLVRRGDKVVTRLEGAAAGPASLLLPNTCQHCRHAACMVDCPTGAIGRDPEGEVFIRPELCTGCGNCAKACPWENIQMAPRPTAHGLAADVAVKCDLCRGYEAPACVEACPTEAIQRIDPARDIGEVAGVLGLRIAGPAAASSASSASSSAASSASAALPVASAAGLLAGSGPAPTSAAPFAAGVVPAIVTHRGPVITAAGAAALVAAGVGWTRHWTGAWTAGHGPGLAAGVLAGLLILALAAYAAPKRLVRRSMRRRSRRAALALDHRPPPRSRTRVHLVTHVALGLLAPACALAHAGARVSASPGGALLIAFALTSLLGAAGAAAYRALPRRLTRLERRGALPEDLAAERDALSARLYREVSGTSDAVKTAAARMLLPYAGASLGWMALALSGRGLADEERRLRRRIDDALAGRGRGRLDGLDAIVRTAVELRALSARRALTAALRAWLPLHIASAAMTVALLLVHAALALLA
ncbi:MAG TPA: cyclic nucleotide-binding domain-containing protein [Kofleriaceae bacterium]|nr:cyclic nucleotide-binding domain-containing protein [Kofleriaceae bacterium]